MNTMKIWMSIIDMVLEHSLEREIAHVRFFYIENFTWDTVMLVEGDANQCVLIDTGVESGLTMHSISDALDRAPKIVEEYEKRKMNKDYVRYYG